jgi:hypothetical protein
MSSPLTEKYKEEVNLFEEYSKEVQADYLAAKNRGDVQAAEQLLGKLDNLDLERPKIDQRFQDAQKQRKGELIQGIASGDLITDKSKPFKSYQVDFDPSGMGSYGSSESFTEVKKTFNAKKAKAALSELFEVPENKVDVESGLGTGITTKLDLLREPDAMEYYLKETLKYPTVIRQVINGKPNFIVEEKNDKQESKYKVVFPSGIQGADVAGFLAAETLPTAASIVGGIGGGIAGAPAGPVGAGAGAVAGSAGAYGVTSSSQDAIARAAMDVPVNYKEILSRRGKEAALGAGIDILTLGMGSKLGAGKIGRTGIDNAVTSNLKEAEELLAKKGYQVTTPLGYTKGTEGGIYERGIAGGFLKMDVGKKMQRVQKTAAEFQEALTKGAPVTNKIESVDMIRKNLEDTANLLSSKEARLAGMPKEFVDRKVAQIMPDKTNLVEAGKGISQVLTRGKEIVRQAKETEFNNFANTANQAGVIQTPEELAAVLSPIVAQSGLGKNLGVDKIFTALANAPADQQAAAQLRFEIQQIQAAGGEVPAEKITRLRDLEEYSQPFDAVRSRNLIQNLQNQVEKDAFGNTKADVVVSEATRAVRGNFEDKLKSVGLTGEWDKFKEAYTDYAAYQKGQIGKMITDNFGDLAIAPEKIVANALSDTKATNDVFNSIKASGDVEGEAFLRDTLQKAYLEKAGITSKSGLPVQKVDFQDEMIDVLWGDAAPRMKSTLTDLKQTLYDANVKVAQIKPEDAERLLQVMPINERKQLIEGIKDKAVVQQKYDNMLKNEIIQKVKKGDYSLTDNIIFGEALLDAKPSDVAEIFNQMTPKMRQDTGADMAAAFFKRFETVDPKFEIKSSSVAGDYAGTKLWDTLAVQKELGNWKRGKGGAPKWVSNVDIMTGSPEMADEIIAFSRIAEANRPLGNAEFMNLRGLGSPTGIKIYTTLEYPMHKMLAVAYGSNKLKPLLRFMNKNIGEAEQAKAMQDMIRGIVTTRTGIQSAIQQSQSDPEFSEQFQTIMLKVGEDIKREKQEKSR